MQWPIRRVSWLLIPLDIATITGGVAYMNHAEVFSENQDDGGRHHRPLAAIH